MILLTVFVDLIGFGIVVPLLPFYTQLLGGGPAVLGLLIASFFLMQFLAAPFLGRLSDRKGRRPVILGTLALATGSYALLAVSNSLILLFAARILSGVASGNLSVAQAYIADRTSPAERAKGMGYIGAAFGVGFAVGPVIGGTLAGFGLVGPALAAMAIAGTNLVLAAALLPESHPVEAGARPAAPRPRGGRIADAFRRPTIRALLATFFVVSFAFSTVPVAYPSLGIAYFGLDAQGLSWIFILIGLVSVAVGTSIGRLAKRFGEERLVVVGTAAIGIALVATPLIRDLAAYVGLTVLLSFGVAVANPLVPSLVSKRTARAEQGSVLGVAQSIGSLGRIPGPTIAGILFQSVGPVAPFLFASVLMAIGFGLSVQVYREGHANTEAPGPRSQTEPDS